MKFPVAIIILVGFISVGKAQTTTSLLRSNDYKSPAAIKSANVPGYEIKLNNPTVGPRLNTNEKFTVHPVVAHHLILYPNLTFFKGTMPIKSGTMHFSQGVQLDKHNFLYFNLGF